MAHPEHRRRLRDHADAIAIDREPRIILEQHVHGEVQRSIEDPGAVLFAEHVDAPAARLTPLLAALAVIALAEREQPLASGAPDQGQALEAFVHILERERQRA